MGGLVQEAVLSYIHNMNRREDRVAADPWDPDWPFASIARVGRDLAGYYFFH